MEGPKISPRIIAFDFDGTLADTTEGILRTYALTIDELELPRRQPELCKATIGVPLREGFRQLYPDASATELDLYTATYRKIYSDSKSSIMPKLYAGVRETLAYLKAKDITLTVASSRSHPSLMELCRFCEIDRYFSLILGGDDVTYAKPHPEPLLVTMKRMDVSTSEAIMVGDMPVDIAMGRSAGVAATIGVTYGNSSRPDLEKAGADFVIDDFRKLTDII